MAWMSPAVALVGSGATERCCVCVSQRTGDVNVHQPGNSPVRPAHVEYRRASGHAVAGALVVKVPVLGHLDTLEHHGQQHRAS